MLLKDTITLLTGGSKGIGADIARKFASEGSHVIFTYLSNEAKAKDLEKELRDMGVKALAVKSDASQMADAMNLVELVVKEYGKIDTLINNAGITRDNLLLRMTEAQWDEVMNTNLKSVFNLTKAVSKSMLKERKGSIINISSIVGLKGQAGQANYAASKSGIIGFTKSIAQELGSRNIRCNAIAPGFIETDMTENLSEEIKKDYFSRIPLARFGKTEEVANVCVFLASPLSSYVTGQTIAVCGGLEN